MNPSSAAALAKRGIELRSALTGQRFIFRNFEITLPKPSVDPNYVLETGGFKSGALLRLRVPAYVQPPPAPKEQFTDIATGRIFYVTTCDPAVPGAATSQEHIVEVRLP